MTFSDIKVLVEEQFPGAILGEDLKATPNALIIDAKKIHAICAFLHESESTYFDMLSCLTGIDNGPESGTMEVVYNLYSIPRDVSLMLKVTLDRETPEVASVSDIWRTANWHEREAYDMFGIRFLNHPDLRRILLPTDWKGHPLRKDYEEQEEYHGMTVVYDRKNKPEDLGPKK